MKRLAMLMIFGLTIGCGTFQGPVVTGRNLTPAEVKIYKAHEAGETYRMVPILPLLTTVDFLSNYEKSFEVSRYVMAPFPIIPISFWSRSSCYDPQGAMTRNTWSYYVPLLISTQRKSNYDKKGREKIETSDITLLVMFGGGQIDGKKYFKFCRYFGPGAKVIHDLKATVCRYQQ